MTNNKPKTIFCDLDGTLVKHPGDVMVITSPDYKLELLPGVKEFLYTIDSNRYHLIITTGRKEGLRDATVKQLQNAGIIYDQLIMGIGGGGRHLINDKKTDNKTKTAFAHNINRNKGIGDLEI